MTVRVEREITVPGPIEKIWKLISDPEIRARSISVVVNFYLNQDNNQATWEIKLPIPLVDQTITVETEDIERDPPHYVRFIGRSKVMRVIGEHELTSTDGETKVTNRFTVEGRIPGIERYFKRNLEKEIKNFENVLLKNINQ